MRASETLIHEFVKDGFCKVGKVKGATKLMRQDSDFPYLADYISVVPRKSTNDFHLEYSRCYPQPKMIFTGEEMYGVCEKILTVWSDGFFLERTGGISDFEQGFGEDAAYEAVRSSFESTIERELPRRSPLEILNGSLFLCPEFHGHHLYGMPGYPGGMPDIDRRDYRGPNGNRQLIFSLFYLLGDARNALFWAKSMVESPEFVDDEYIKSIHEWADVAIRELEKGRMREVLLPKWAKVRSYLPACHQ